MASHFDSIFFVDSLNPHSREIFGIKPASDFVSFDELPSVSEDKVTMATSRPLVVSRWARLRTYCLDKAFNLDPSFSDFATYAPYMEPESEVSSDVVANHVDALATITGAGKMPSKAEIEKLPLKRVVLCTLENGIGFFIVQEKTITPGGWIWGKAVVEKILTQTHFAGVEDASSESYVSVENLPVSTPAALAAELGSEGETFTASPVQGATIVAPSELDSAVPSEEAFPETITTLLPLDLEIVVGQTIVVPSDLTSEPSSEEDVLTAVPVAGETVVVMPSAELPSEVIDQQAEETLRKFEMFYEPTGVSAENADEAHIPTQGTSIVEPNLEEASKESSSAAIPQWTPPTHFLERFSEVESQLHAVTMECERLKELVAAGSSPPSSVTAPPAVARKSSGSNIRFGDRPIASFGAAVTEEFFKFDRSTLRPMKKMEEENSN